MDESINRHKSTRWVQSSTASYGDEWGDEEEFDEQFDQDKDDLSHDNEEETVSSPLTELMGKLQQATVAEDEPTSENKRASRFFVTNPDVSDTESVNEAKVEDLENRSTELDDIVEDYAKDILPTPPLKFHSRASSRNVSGIIIEDPDGVVSGVQEEVDSELQELDPLPSEPELLSNGVNGTLSEENEEIEEENEESVLAVHDDSLDVDHQHFLETKPLEAEDSQYNLSVTPNDYSLSQSASSGSLSTGSWSMRSSSQFINGLSSARDSFIGRLKNDRRGSVETSSILSKHEDPAKDDSSPDQGNRYLDSSSSDEDDRSMKFNPGQSINFGHWRPNTSNFRNDFIKDTSFNDSDNALSTIDNENEEYDDSYSVMTDQSSLRYPDEEGHFFTKPLNHSDNDVNQQFQDNLSSRKNSDGTIDAMDMTADEPVDTTVDEENEEDNVTETEEIKDEDEDTDTEKNDSTVDTSTSSFNDSSLATSQKQKYSSLLSDVPSSRQSSTSSSYISKNRVASDASKFTQDTTESSVASSQQTVVHKKAVHARNFIPFDFKPIQKLTNAESRINELKSLRQKELQIDTGLQEWLSSQLTKVSTTPDTYESLGALTLSAYKQLTPTTHLHGHSVADMISRKHSLNFGGVVGHGRLRLKNKVGDHGQNLAKGIFNRGKKIMRNSSGGADAGDK